MQSCAGGNIEDVHGIIGGVIHRTDHDEIVIHCDAVAKAVIACKRVWGEPYDFKVCWCAQ